jgi:signal recognition particle GTPase
MSEVGVANGCLMCTIMPGMLKVLMAAGNTFRAAASEQLEVWAQQTGSEIVMPEGPNISKDGIDEFHIKVM